EGHEPARVERGGIAGATAPVVDRLLGLEPVPRVVFSLVLLGVLVMIVVDLESRMGVGLPSFLGSLQILPWLLVVIIIKTHHAGPEAAFGHPFPERLLLVLERTGARIESHSRKIGNGLMRRAGIRHHHRMLAVGWLEEVIDPVMLHETA